MDNQSTNGKSFLNINPIMSILIDQTIAFKNPFFSQQGMDGLASCSQNLIPHFLSLYSFHFSHIGFLSIPCLPLARSLSHNRAFEHAVSSAMNSFPVPSSTMWLLLKSQLKHHLFRKALLDLPG